MVVFCVTVMATSGVEGKVIDEDAVDDTQEDAEEENDESAQVEDEEIVVPKAASMKDKRLEKLRQLRVSFSL